MRMLMSMTGYRNNRGREYEDVNMLMSMTGYRINRGREYEDVNVYDRIQN